MEDTQEQQMDFTTLTADLVAAYVSQNPVSQDDLPTLIASVHSTLSNLGNTRKAPEEDRQKPPIPIKKTITPDYLISLEDSRHYKSLKRHLSKQGLTPEQYRQKWGLPKDYPMVAPNYAKQRSELARAMGLGRKPQNAAPPAPAAANDEAKAPRKKGRPTRKAAE